MYCITEMSQMAPRVTQLSRYPPPGSCGAACSCRWRLPARTSGVSSPPPGSPAGTCSSGSGRGEGTPTASSAPGTVQAAEYFARDTALLNGERRFDPDLDHRRPVALLLHEVLLEGRQAVQMVLRPLHVVLKHRRPLLQQLRVRTKIKKCKWKIENLYFHRLSHTQYIYRQQQSDVLRRGELRALLLEGVLQHHAH